MAPLQKRAWIGLGIGVATSAAILALFITKGATSWNEDTGMRLIVYALFLAGLASWAVLLFLTHRKPGRTEVIVDERDRIIMSRAPMVQLWAVVISLIIWTIALTEVYSDQGDIPIVFPTLMFFSVIIVNMLAQAIGILIGYRRMG